MLSGLYENGLGSVEDDSNSGLLSIFKNESDPIPEHHREFLEEFVPEDSAETDGGTQLHPIQSDIDSLNTLQGEYSNEGLIKVDMAEESVLKELENNEKFLKKSLLHYAEYRKEKADSPPTECIHLATTLRLIKTELNNRNEFTTFNTMCEDIADESSDTIDSETVRKFFLADACKNGENLG